MWIVVNREEDGLTMSDGLASSRRSLLVGAALSAPAATGLLAGIVPASALTTSRRSGTPAAPAAPAALAVGWHVLTESAVAAAAFPEPITQTRTWAVSWLAAARATKGQTGSRASAAFVQSLHDTLVALVPAQQAVLDTALANSLATIPDGTAKTQGTQAGAAAAAAVLSERNGDGTDTASVNTAFTPGAPGPGVWQLTPPTSRAAVRAGQENAKPSSSPATTSSTRARPRRSTPRRTSRTWPRSRRTAARARRVRRSSTRSRSSGTRASPASLRRSRASSSLPSPARPSPRCRGSWRCCTSPAWMPRSTWRR